MSGTYEQTVAEHAWTPMMDSAALCGDCPECGKQGQHEHTEFSGGDGERGFVEYGCAACGTAWTDSYRLVSRTVYPALRDTETVPVDDRETIWVDGVEQRLYSLDEAYEIWCAEQEYLAEMHHTGLGGEVAIVIG